MRNALTCAVLATILLAACAAEASPHFSPQDVSIDPSPSSQYCLQRFCPAPLSELSILQNWTVASHDLSTPPFRPDIRSQYAVEMHPKAAPAFTSAVQPCCEYGYPIATLHDYPIDALTGITNTVITYKDNAAAVQGFKFLSQRLSQSPDQRAGVPLGSLSQPLESIGYNDALIDPEHSDVTLWVRTGATVIQLDGQFDPTALGFQPEVRDATTRGVILAAALLLARADDPAAPMTLSGQIYLDGHLIPSVASSTGTIDFLSALLGPYRLALSEFSSRPDYTIELDGTKAMKGQHVTFELAQGPACAPCISGDQVTFQPGAHEKLDLHFQSSR
jgi:hypothetical protein